MRGAFLLFLLVAVSAQVPINRRPRVLLVDGKRPDPCAIESWDYLALPYRPNPDFQFDQLPGSPLNLVEQTNCPSTPPQASTIFLPLQFQFPVPGIRRLTLTMEGNSGGPGTPPLPANFPGGRSGFVCLSRAEQPCSNGCDDAFYRYTLTPVANTNPQQYSFGISTQPADVPLIDPAGQPPLMHWTDVVLRGERLGARRLCLVDSPTNGSPARGLWTGAYIATDFDCNQGQPCDQTALDQGRSRCCVSTVQSLRVGVCVDPRTTTCCGSGFARSSIEKCCNQATEFVQFLGQPCPCSAASQCITDPTNPEPETSCCINTKFPELTPVAVPNGRTDGQCYNPTTHRCCNTGARFDPGSQQCCVINGLQSRDEPCRCSTNAHCATSVDGSTDTARHTCCLQTRPPLPETQQCTIHQNYPSGQGRPPVQACLGVCQNNDFQVCCNGRVCQRAFEKCCNTTCCNRYIGSCEQSRRPGQPRSVFNWLLNHPTNDQIRFKVGSFITCSVVEQMSVVKAFFIFILPTFLLAAMLLGLALALVFANQVSARLFTLEERALLVFGILTTLFAFPLFFSPFWKFGVVVQIACIIAIIAAAALNFPLAVFAVFIALIATFYIVDPFHGNGYLNFAEGRLDNGDIDPWTSGVLWSVYKMWREVEPGRINGEVTRDTRFCTRYYDYFAFDWGVQDFVRFDNPVVTTFGYCSRGWTFTLLMFCGFMLIFMILTLALLLMVALQRWRKDVYEPIELEIRDAGQVIDPFLLG